jgi:2-polyprenyl-3-methyl-5-hydroxy-6-metoxy-1,4-benzoquinol methylase
MDRKEYEVSYVDKLSKEEVEWLYTKPFGIFNRDESQRTFHDFSTFLYLLNLLAPKAKKGADLGCGPGWLSIFLAKMGYEMLGVDIAPKMIEVAKERAKKENCNTDFQVGDFEEAKVPENLDFIVIYDALHHAPENKKLIELSLKSLKHGGVLVISEPNVVHATDEDSLEAQERFGVTERGLSVNGLKQELKSAGFRNIKRYHASGQASFPRSENFKETIKLIFYPLLSRFYFGNKRTRIWLTAQK